MIIPRAVAKLFRANPTGAALLLTVRFSWDRVRSGVVAFILGASGLRLGAGSQILGGRHIAFGKGIYAGRSLWLEAVTTYGAQSFKPNIVIGDYVCFSDNVHISAIDSITVGAHTLFGSKVYVSDHNHGVYRGYRQSSPDEPPARRLLGGGGPVVIGENVWIGDNSVIVGPADIGSGAIIAANAVVRGEVPANTMVAGAPAKPVKVFNPNTRLWERA
jgi:acetyltransferase-like isoleucine patch superfamily enzyme